MNYRFFFSCSRTDTSSYSFKHGLRIFKLENGTIQCRNGEVVVGAPIDLIVEITPSPASYLQSYPLEELPNCIREMGIQSGVRQESRLTSNP